MTSRSKKNRKSQQDLVESGGESARETGDSGSDDPTATIAGGLSKAARRVISLAIIFYLAVVVLGPLSNPIGSEFLTRRLAKMVAPLHQSLYLGHGYRFFGPDPGPSHLVVYRITSQDGDVLEGQFPDREKHWPRLIYHRWFMLSETVFNEHAMTPDLKSFRESDAELDAQVKLLRRSGKFAMSKHIANERQLISQRYDDTLKRIDGLVTAIASHLLTANDGQRIELFVQERSIPFTGQVLTGTQLDDPQFLSPLTKIGEFELGADGKARSLENISPASGGSDE